ncbi:azurin [Puniceicoccales bacterium CK1056]|uniref:Azurin n=1 Tax=Oceanipulchritudo coccoides TaxID=2706888 RepID=A0A6B2LYE2_9BACT|nr:plastocyanin/azurin family copper-binding protein [Oceanipulchritudo coccoides]NDV61106.1 azurin [Oceanipulchritudo coccoides]
MIKNKLITITTALLLGVILSGCGKSDSSGSASSAKAAAEPKATPDTFIIIEANDKMKFNKESFTVGSGDTVQLTLKNVGTMPKFSMGHNVVILEKGSSGKEFAEAAMNSAASDYIPATKTGEIVAHTKLLGGGEEDTIVFVAPSSKGEYPFICSFPGHFQVSMKGVMHVN